MFVLGLLLLAAKATAQTDASLTMQQLQLEKEALEKQLAAASAASPTAAGASEMCYTGTIVSGFTTMTEDDVMEALWPQVSASLAEHLRTHEGMENFLERSGTCQLKCFEDMVDLTYRTLYGKLGPDYLSRTTKVQRVFVKATAGAFAACYPQRNEQRNKLLVSEMNLAEKIVRVTKQPGAPAFTDYEIPDGLQCMNEGKESQFPIADFMAGFTKELNMLMSEDVYFAKSCQKECLSSAVELSVLTLFRTNVGGAEALDHAISGAIHACVPEVTTDTVNSLIASSQVQLQNVQSKAAAADQVCYGGGIIGVGGKMLKEKKFLAQVMGFMDSAVVAVTNEDAELNAYMSNNGTCQAKCLEEIMPPTLHTLYGKLGVHFTSSSKMIKAIFHKALMGAFGACYPNAPTIGQLKVSNKIVASLSSKAPFVVNATIPSKGDCKHSDYKEKWESTDKELFITNFTTMFKLKVSDDLEMTEFFKTKAKDCQVPCMVNSTVPLVVGTLMQHTWVDVKTWRDTYVNGISGAIRACFPEIPQKHIDALTKEAMKTIVPPSEPPKPKKKKCGGGGGGNSSAGNSSSGGNSSSSGGDEDCEASDSNSSSSNSSAAPAPAPAAGAAPAARLYDAEVPSSKPLSAITLLTFVGLAMGVSLALVSGVALMKRQTGRCNRSFEIFEQVETYDRGDYDPETACQDVPLVRTTML